MTKKERFLAACRQQPVDRPPVCIMRQAGRYLPEYRELRAKVGSFKDLYRQPDLAAEVLMQPLRRFELDAAILFSDILVIPEAMGIGVDFQEGGPKMSHKINSLDSLNRLVRPDVQKELAFVSQALQASRAAIGPDRALIGFSGSPYTLASYMVEGGSGGRTSEIKKMLFAQPEMLNTLLDKITEVVIDYLNMQIDNGADAVQLFDTWAGDLGPAAFSAFALPHVKKIFSELKKRNVPLIYYVNGVAGIMEQLADTGANVQGIDWRINPAEAVKRTGGKVAIQGNLDPLELFAPEAYIRSRVQQIHRDMQGHAHIMNLGHGILPETPIAGAAAFVDEVTRLGR